MVKKKKVFIDERNIKVRHKYRARIEIAVMKANEILNNTEFLEFVASKHDFNLSNDHGTMIVEKLRATLQKATLVGYRPPWWKHRSVYAYVMHDSDVIHMNSKKFRRSIASLTGTIVHEYMHVIGYSHGNNTPKGSNRYNSVPYWMGSAAKNWIEKDK